MHGFGAFEGGQRGREVGGESLQVGREFLVARAQAPAGTEPLAVRRLVTERRGASVCCVYPAGVAARHTSTTSCTSAARCARGLRNKFPLRPARRYLFIAGGIGITQILPMLAEADAAVVRWRLPYAGRRLSSMAFLDELAAYGEAVVVRPQDRHGLLVFDGYLGDPGPDTLVYCCGPEPLLAAVEERCRAWLGQGPPGGAVPGERARPKPAAV